jgi:hypothetical protein
MAYNQGLFSFVFFRIVAAAVFKSVALYSLIFLFSAVGIAVFWVRL